MSLNTTGQQSWSNPEAPRRVQPPGSMLGARGDTPLALLLGASVSSLPQVLVPTGTPAFRVEPHEIEESKTFAVSARGTGQRRVRRLYTAAERFANVALLLENAAQAVAFEAWYQSTLIAGTLPFTAAVASESGSGIAYWKAFWTAPPVYDPIPSGQWTVSGRLLLVGSPGVAPPAISPATLAVGLALRGSVSIIVPAQATLAVGLPLIKVTNLGALSVGLALARGAPALPMPHGSLSFPNPITRDPTTYARLHGFSGSTSLHPQAPDPSFASVSLLMHMETGVDSSSIHHAMTLNGNATLSAAQAQFGLKSANFIGSSSSISTPNSASLDIATGDFTIECWFRPNALGIQHTLIINNTTTGAFGYVLFVTNANKAFAQFFNNSSVSIGTITGTTSLATGQWYHLAATRNGSTFTLWVNGASEGTPLTSAATLKTGDPFTIGAQGDGTSSVANGWIDEVRVTKGVARYTGAFTPPAAQFADF